MGARGRRRWTSCRPRLNALLGARLDRLESQERDALERGAVEGELFHQAAVVELSEEPARPSVPGELDELARKDLIRLAAASLVAGGIAYRFKHILVREAAYRGDREEAPRRRCTSASPTGSSASPASASASASAIAATTAADTIRARVKGRFKHSTPRRGGCLLSTRYP